MSVHKGKFRTGLLIFDVATHASIVSTQTRLLRDMKIPFFYRLNDYCMNKIILISLIIVPTNLDFQVIHKFLFYFVVVESRDTNKHRKKVFSFNL